LVSLGAICSTAWADEGIPPAGELPPPRVIDRRTGVPVVPQGPSPRGEREPRSAREPERDPPRASKPAPERAPASPRTTPERRRPPGDETATLSPRRVVPQGFLAQVPIRFSVDYFHLPDSSDTLDVVAGYPLCDGLTVGAIGRLLVDDAAFSGGPMADARLLRESTIRPRVSVGGYSLFGGDRADDRTSLYLAASKRLPLSGQSGLFRALRLQGGVGYTWRRRDVDSDGWDWWLRPEIELPARLYLFGEYYRNCSCTGSLVTGIRWASPIGVNFSFSLYQCVGTRMGFPGLTIDAYGNPTWGSFDKAGGPVSRSQREYGPNTELGPQVLAPRARATREEGFEAGD
jgi:hypothetical protein